MRKSWYCIILALPETAFVAPISAVSVVMASTELDSSCLCRMRPSGKRATRLVSRIELQDRIRPQLAFLQLAAHVVGDALVADVNEALDVAPVLVDGPVTEGQDVEGHISTYVRSVP